MTHFEASPLPEAIRREIETLASQVESVRAGLRTGFEALNDRMDATNDHLKELNHRTQKNEKAIAVLEDRSDRPEPQPKADGEDRGVTVRDVKMVVAGSLSTVAILSFLFKILPAVIKALAP